MEPIVISIIVILTAVVFYLLGRLIAERGFSKRIIVEREDAAKRSRAVVGGQFSEQLAPYLPGFQYRPTEAKFLGKPVDFIVFEGLDEKSISGVVFLEVKSGASRLSATEKSLKEAIAAGNVRYETYQVPEELTSSRSRPAP
jgi:predicted Holliday junction resolvase-like endonuclease